jgi:8-oxo-dGTP pyrophosphatase MutT (NUDIX family)
VIDVAEGESVRGGLTREVGEETGLVVDEWTGPVYQVEALAERLGWLLRVEVHRAVSYSGHLAVNDPDGIVVDARFVPWDDTAVHLAGCRQWVAEPLAAWLAERWKGDRSYRYRLEGDDVRVLNVVRL